MPVSDLRGFHNGDILWMQWFPMDGCATSREASERLDNLGSCKTASSLKGRPVKDQTLISFDPVCRPSISGSSQGKTCCVCVWRRGGGEASQVSQPTCYLLLPKASEVGLGVALLSFPQKVFLDTSRLDDHPQCFRISELLVPWESFHQSSSSYWSQDSIKVKHFQYVCKIVFSSLLFPQRHLVILEGPHTARPGLVMDVR